jgi:hypothetical protein|tara:strand:+ start:336 stop:551 length:216 start_codon:yes stop_codon:yes gene_type:complete
MSWNYRVLKHVTEGQEGYQIHEVYYYEDGSIKACTEEAVVCFGDSEEELKESFKLMEAAFDKPAIPYESLI